MIEIGEALTDLVPKTYDENEKVGEFDDDTQACFAEFDCLDFQDKDTFFAIEHRDKIQLGGSFDYDLRHLCRSYNAAIFLLEGLHRLKRSHQCFSEDLNVYKFSLARATNRLSHELRPKGTDSALYNHYVDYSMRLFCEVIYNLDRTRFGLYIKRSFAYLGLMIQKMRRLSLSNAIDENIPEFFERLSDLESTWRDPEQAFIIAASITPDILDVVVCTRYAKFLENDERYDEALAELQKTDNLSSFEKWFPNNIKMKVYSIKHQKERDDNLSKKEPVSPVAREYLKSAVKYGQICLQGHSPLSTLLECAKAMYWLGSEFTRTKSYEVVLKDDNMVNDALFVIKRIYDEYRNQDLTQVYKLHAECCKVLGYLEEAFQYMVHSQNSSRRYENKTSPSLHYLWKYGCVLCERQTTPNAITTRVCLHIKFAIEQEMKHCRRLIQNSDSVTRESKPCQDILQEKTSWETTASSSSSPPVCQKWKAIFVQVRKMSEQYPEVLKQLLEHSLQTFIHTYGTESLMTMGVNCLRRFQREWTRTFNEKKSNYVREITADQLFRPSSIFPGGNKNSFYKFKEFDFCVIHSIREQEWVACCLKPELEDGPEKFKGKYMNIHCLGYKNKTNHAMSIYRYPSTPANTLPLMRAMSIVLVRF